MVAVAAGHTEITAYLRLQLTPTASLLNAVPTEVQPYIPSMMDEYNPNTKASDKMKENQVHLVSSKASTSTSSGSIPMFGQTYMNYPFYIADTSHRLNTASTNQQQQYDRTNETKNQTQNTLNYTKSHDTKFMAQSTTSSTVVREESLAVESDTSIQPSTSAVDIHQKQTEKMDDTYLNVPTPAFLPMSPGGLDEIMIQSPATLDIINDVLQTDELTNISSTKSNEKDTLFTIQPQAPPLMQTPHPQTCLYQASTSKPGSSLFEPSISPIPQIHPPQSFIPPSDRNVRRTKDLNTSSPIHDTEKDDNVNTLVMQLKEQDAIIASDRIIIDRQAGKLQGKGKTIAGKAQEIVSKKEKIKELEEEREHSREELTQKEMKLKGKEKTLLEYKDKEDDLIATIDLKERRLIAKDKRIAEMETYNKDEAKKRKVDDNDRRAANNYTDNLSTETSKGHTIKGKGKTIAAKEQKIKELEEERKHNMEELATKDMKLKGKGKAILEYQHKEEDLKATINLKETRLIAKDKKIAEIGKYHEDLNNAVANHTQDLHSADGNFKLSEDQAFNLLHYFAPLVCQIEVLGNINSTGFVVGTVIDNSVQHHYILTVYHGKLSETLRDSQNRYQCKAKFGPITVRIVPPGLYWNIELDYVMAQLEPSAMLDDYLSGKVPLGQHVTCSDPKHDDVFQICGFEANKVIDYGVKCVSINHNNVVRKHGNISTINNLRKHSYTNKIYPLSGKFLFYDCSVRHGTSGGPCLSTADNHVYAIHCGAIYQHACDLEYGILLKHVVEDIIRQIQAPPSAIAAPRLQPSAGQYVARHLQLHEVYRMFPHTPQPMDSH